MESDAGMDVEVKVVIVGAGIAGIGAGRRLMELGWIPGEDFVILEANSRVGGRMHTIDCVSSKAANREEKKTVKEEAENKTPEEDSNDASSSSSSSSSSPLLPFGIDVGAQWVHGRVGNPIYKLAFDQFGLEMTKPYKGFEMFAADGTPVFHNDELSQIWIQSRKTYNRLSIDIDERMDNIINGRDDGAALRKGRTQVNKEPYCDISVLDAWDKAVSVYGLGSSSFLNIKTIEGQLLAWLQSSTEQYEGADSSELSLVHEHYEVSCPGGDTEILGGYKLLIDKLLDEEWTIKNSEMKRRLRDSIRRSHSVTSIDYGSSASQHQVTIRCRNGKTFKCNSCIITLPLGVLQKSLSTPSDVTDMSHLVTFQPPLPKWKSDTILKMGVGLMNKVVLEFPKVFWSSDVRGVGYASDDDKGAWRFFYNVEHVTQRPILMGFLTAKFAWKMEKQSDEEHIQGAMSVLRRIYGDDIPEPTSYYITRWGSNPYSYGSYSFMKVGTVHDDYGLLMKDIDSCLFWAGEHTFREHIGCVHGAYLSGIRAADQSARKKSGEKKVANRSCSAC
eukprot:TRINITY_DN1711_c0_g1_i2.p1 TRINITY_DN1711_c0_g1~~TRINITY_DN1711_c0_g1_i2.p1  ORF type:complete len:559 (+),score=112.60 TRINITY_DN1711_c0_g1_i2:34-1710(+)